MASLTRFSSARRLAPRMRSAGAAFVFIQIAQRAIEVQIGGMEEADHVL